MAMSDLFYLDADGLHVADYEQVLEFYKDEYKKIYGDDVNLDADSQDGQWVAVQALAIFDTMQVSLGVYNSYSPISSVGDALTRNVKINGLQKLVPTKSTVDVTCVGTNGTSIVNGYAKDDLGRKWFLPSPTNIGASGSVIVTAEAEFEGALEAAIGTVDIIGTPTKGWLSVTNATVAVEGDPVESDFELRQRQRISTTFPSQSIFEGLGASILALDGVTKYQGYENDTNIPVDGIVAHTIACVVEGGVAQDIAEAIFNKKTVGCGTQGTTAVVVQDIEGNNNTINFYRPTEVPTEVVVEATGLTGYLSTTDDLIKTAVLNYINALSIGEDVLYTKIYSWANLPFNAQGDTFNITAIKIDTVAGGTPVEADIAIDFDELATIILANITVTVT